MASRQQHLTELKAALTHLCGAYRHCNDRRLLPIIKQVRALLSEAVDAQSVTPILRFCDAPPEVLSACRPQDSAQLPHWDGQLHLLRLGDQEVKHFLQPSPNQEAVLAAFEEGHWQSRIDDPLPPDDGQPPKRRLNLTIWRLNAHQRHRLIRFRGDGTGEGICWEPIVATPAACRRAA